MSEKELLENKVEDTEEEIELALSNGENVKSKIKDFVGKHRKGIMISALGATTVGGFIFYKYSNKITLPSDDIIEAVKDEGE